MLVLHLTWLPAPPERVNGGFFVWAETTERLAVVPTRGRLPVWDASQPRRHPFAVVDVRTLLPATVQANAYVATLELPTGTRVPLPSPGLPVGTVPTAVLARPTSPELLPWFVEGAIVSNALPWIADGAPLDGSVHLASSSQVWVEAARLALELIAGERFLPTIGQTADGVVEARWKAALGVPDWHRLRQLAARFPAAAWCAITPPAWAGRESAETWLHAFLDDAIDAFVRRDALSLPAPQEAPVWAKALLNGAEVHAPSAVLRRWPEQSQNWSSLLLAPVGKGGLRTCFRLEPPRQESDPWSLHFLVQASDDPSLSLDAGSVWDVDRGTVAWLKNRYEHPQERLLTDLARVGRFFPPVERVLRERRPTQASLSAQEAWGFLRNAAPMLQSAGYGIMLPKGWNGGATPLSVRVQVRSPKKRGGTQSGQDFLAFDWQVAVGEEPLTAAELERLATLKVPLVKLRGQWVEIRPDEIAATLQAWERLTKQGLRLGDILGMQAGAGRIAGLAVSNVEATGWVGEALAALRSEDRMKLLPPPRGLQATLRPYQQRGYSWLEFLTRLGLGACLADDMGLGKTIQVLAYIQRDREEGGKDPWLLFCPTSLVGNWRREAERFVPDLKLLVHHGSGRESGKRFLAAARKSDLVLSTYALSYRDEEDLKAVSWAGVIVDEAQNIKNAETRQARAIAAIEAPRRIAMTGTPVENRLSELWSILEFANPGYLGPAIAFQKSTAIPIERLGDTGVRERLRKQVAPFILRRHKTDPTIIRDLPEKMEAKVYCRLTKEQVSLYQAVLKEQMEAIEQADDGMKRRAAILGTLARLKQVCNHPAHFLKDGSRLDGRSGKLDRLAEMLEEVAAAGERALVFTQFTEMGHLLVPWLASTLQRDVLFLHGGTPAAERERMVQRFSDPVDGPAVFVLSLKAGGVGLNLTAANHVFHFDRWWNPAVENQATDRAFRIGQKKNVQVHKFICGGTLEEAIDQMIERKKDLADNVVGSGEAVLTEMSAAQLRKIFTLRTEDVIEE